MRAPAFSTWTAEHKRLILNDRAQGMKMRDLRLKYHHAEGTLRRFFESVGTSVKPCALRQLTKPDDKPKYMPNTWTPSDCISLADKQHVLCDFTPMLTVDIQTGKVLVDRRDEVMRRMSERGVYGRW